MNLDLFTHIYEQLARQLAKESSWRSYRLIHEARKEPKYRIELQRVGDEKPGFKVQVDGVKIRAEWAELDRLNQSVVIHVLETDLHHQKSIDRLVRFARRAKRQHSWIKNAEDIVFLSEKGSKWGDQRAWKTEYVYHQSTKDPVVVNPSR